MAKSGERLLVKAKRKKIKGNATIDESIGVSEFSSKIKKKARAQKAKNGERLLVKAKRRKIKENATIDGSIGVLGFSSKIKNKAGVHKAKNGKRLLVKAKRRKIKENATIDESIGVLEFSSKIKKKAGAHKELKRRKLDHLKNNNKTSIKKKQKKAMRDGGDGAVIKQLSHDDEHTVEGIGSGRLTNVGNLECSNYQTLNEVDSSIEPKVAASESKIRTKKVTKDFKYKNKRRSITVKASNTEDTQGEVGEDKVDEIPLVDEDCTRGMKKLKRRKLDHLKNNNKTSLKKKQKKAMRDGGDGAVIKQLSHDDEHTVEGIGSGRLTNVDNLECSNYQTLNEIDSSIEPKVAASESKIRTKEVMKDFKYKNKRRSITVKASNTEDTQGEVGEDKVDEIPLVDEDCTRGMKKWLIRYKESRPGLKVLQQRIDEFVTTHEEQQEQERKEREAHAAEGGWTVVVHHKGRKKTTDIESGTTVGSVAPAAVMDKISKKKKNIVIDFYRFQKKEAKRNELVMLQSKFEQDRKRIQQLRATRKFKPY